MYHGLVKDSAVIGTAKRIAHAGKGGRRRTKESGGESEIKALLSIIAGIFAVFFA
jgi:hypothetical protein